MVIDFHVHVREGKGEIKNLLAAMDAYGIDMAVIHPIASENKVLGYGDNSFVGKLVKDYPDRLMGFASVLPQRAEASPRHAELSHDASQHEYHYREVH